MFIDSHCHLHDRQFFAPDEAEKILQKARENGVKKIICIGTDPEDSLAARDFAAAHKNVYWTFGIHPEECEKWPDEKFKIIFSEEYKRSAAGESRSDSPRVTLEEKMILNFSLPPIAIGEIGLDYHSEGYNRQSQIALFNEMLQLATDLNLPVSFHVRNAFDDFFPIVQNFPKIRGVVHSFTDSKKTLKKLLETTDFYIGVNGLATYSTLPTPPLDRTLLETDAPFLSPIRGGKNDPSNIPLIAQHFVTPEISLSDVAKITSENAQKLFHML